MNKTKRFEKAKWLAMLLCIALMAPSATEAQETNPLQEFIDSVKIPLKDLVGMILEGKIPDGKTQTAVLKTLYKLGIKERH